MRTNNDVEGWHGMLNRHVKRGNLSLYLMVRLLHEQAQLVDMQVRLVCEEKVKRRQRKLYRQVQGKILANILLGIYQRSSCCPGVHTSSQQTWTDTS